MAGINTKKAVVGGLVAAVVFTVIDFVVWGVLLKEAMEANSVRLGLDPGVGSSASGMILWAISELVFGQLVVWTYAAMRPRFGPGVKTAVYAGMVPWVTMVMGFAGLAQGGVFSTSFYFQGMIYGLVSIMAGSIAGAAVYQEAA